MKRNVKAITLGGIFSAIYMIMTILSVYVFNVLSVVTLLIMPIFAAYYASVYKFKEVFVFNISTIVVCLIGGASDPFFTLLYILPTLIIGDVYGLLNHLKIKLIATIFLQSITFSVTNLLSIYLANFIYEIDILSYIFPNGSQINDYSLSILFILSAALSIFSTLFTYGELNKIHITKEIEKDVNFSNLMIGICFTIIAIVSSFLSKNISHLFSLLALIISIFSYLSFLKNKKHKELIIFITIILFVSIILATFALKANEFLSVIFNTFLLMIILVKLIEYLYNKYNINRKKEE